MSKRRINRMTSSDEGKPAKSQIQSPCVDCPFLRTAIPGWLGTSHVNEMELCPPEEYHALAHSGARIDCHVHLNVQCAGAAIYRTNVVKMPNDPSVLLLPEDKVHVFASGDEFLTHHKKGGLERS